MSQSSRERREIISKMSSRLLRIWLVVILLFLAGCGLGSSMMRANHLTYNDAVQFETVQ
jgi:hypothetical protein